MAKMACAFFGIGWIPSLVTQYLNILMHFCQKRLIGIDFESSRFQAFKNLLQFWEMIFPGIIGKASGLS